MNMLGEPCVGPNRQVNGLGVQQLHIAMQENIHMPIKINELIIQFKVYDEQKQMHPPTHTLIDVFPTTEQQRLLLAKDLLDLLEIQEAR